MSTLMRSKWALTAFHSQTRLQRETPGWRSFDHVLPFDVQRVWDELEGIDWPRVWTSERDHQVWDLLQN